MVRSDDIPPLEIVEKEIMPFRNNETYEQLFKLAVACKRAGFSIETTTDRILWWLNNSPDYSGPLLNHKDTIDGRVHHIFGKKKTNTIPLKNDLSPYLPTINNLVSRHPFVKQRTKAVRKFLIELLRWKDYHDEVSKDKSLIRYYDDKYEFYRLNRSKGLYPLPSNLLKKWNKNYPSILKWLLSIGLLEESGHSYSPQKHVCKHYFINTDIFEEESETDEEFDDSLYV